MLFKQKDFEGAKGYFTTGLSLKPEAEEFQFALFLAEEELKKIGKYVLLGNDQDIS